MFTKAVSYAGIGAEGEVHSGSVVRVGIDTACCYPATATSNPVIVAYQPSGDGFPQHALLRWREQRLILKMRGHRSRCSGRERRYVLSEVGQVITPVVMQLQQFTRRILVPFGIETRD